jgi:hypothetical protein
MKNPNSTMPLRPNGRADLRIDSWHFGGVLHSLLWLMVVLVAGSAIHAQRPPDALGAETPLDQFSATRAIEQVRQFAQRPHPVGSVEQERVRAYLVGRLASLSANPRVEVGTGVVELRDRSVLAGSVHNIVATLPGTSSQHAVLLVAHYDSVPLGPGAGDDGAGVAAILETLRALQAGPPLKNDVRVVFTDGEEAGLLGASAYVAAHPQLVSEVGLVMNFEGRGSSGPVGMFETSDGNGWLIQQFAAAAPYPNASSLTYTVYKMLPNDTDLTVFKRAGLAGLNFAFIGGLQNYHNSLDNVANLQPATMQHMGSYALALTRHFGNVSLVDTRQPDQVYFNGWGNHLIHYSPGMMWALLAVGGVLLAAVVGIGVRQRRLKFTHVLLGFAGFFLLLLSVVASVCAAWWLIDLLIGKHLLLGDTRSNQLLVAGLILVGVAGAVLMQRWLVRRRDWLAPVVGTLFGFAVLAVVVSIFLPGGSFLLEWPLMASALGVLLTLVSRRRLMAVLWLAFGAVPALLLFAPLVDSMLVTLSLNKVSVPVIAVLLGLLVTVATPLFACMSRAWRVCVPVLLLGAVGCIVYGSMLSHFSVTHPQRDTLYYAVDADQNTASWISYDAAPDAFTTQFLGANPTRGTAPSFAMAAAAPTLSTTAPLLPFAAPAVTVDGDSMDNGTRTLSMHIVSPRQADGLLLRLGAASKLLSVAWDGHRVPVHHGADVTAPWTLTYAGLPAAGVNLELRLAGKEPLECKVADRSVGLPVLPGRDDSLRHPTILVYGNNVTVSRTCAL